MRVQCDECGRVADERDMLASWVGMWLRHYCADRRACERDRDGGES